MSEPICFPRIILNAPGALLELPTLLSQLGYRSPMILSGSSPAELQHTNNLVQQLELFRIRHALFSDIPEEPEVSEINKNIRRFFTGGDQMIPDAFDVIVAIGNGELMQLAKQVSKECGQIPLITAPVTLDLQHASASTEAGPASSPIAIIHDSHLITQTPLFQQLNCTADTLLRALDYLSSEQRSLFNDQQVYTMIRLLHSNLGQLISQPAESEAQSALQLAATLAGTVSSGTGTGPLRQTNRSICTYHQLPRNTVFPELLSLGISSAANSHPEAFIDCARALHLADQSTTAQVAIERLSETLEQLAQQFRLPDLNYFGITQDQLGAQLSVMKDHPPRMYELFQTLSGNATG